MRKFKRKYYNKYNAKKIVTPDGIFDSKKEWLRWEELKAKQKAGQISCLSRQVSYTLIPSQSRGGKVVERACKYIADFEYVQNGRTVVEDAKGYRTKEYVVKRKLMLSVHGIMIREV